MTGTIIIHKCDENGHELIAYPGNLLELDDTRIVVEARFNLESRNVGGLWLERGDRFVETYYTDRWYNVFAIYAGEASHFKGWYANVSRPARLQGDQLYADDLALDLLVFPEGRMRVLDEDEFAALTLPVEERALALAALKEMKHLAETRQAPFNAGSVRPLLRD